MILFLHNRYRTTGGEERAVEDLVWLVREQLGEDAELLERDSARLRRTAAAAGILRGGSAPADIGRAVRMTGARVVHVHNIHPSLGWRAVAAARQAGARVVMHLHQYRLVCAVGVCFTAGRECTRCHGRNTLPGVVHRCRGTTGEAIVYAAGLSLWQRRLARQVDAFIVPSEFARRRLADLGAPLGRTHVLPHVVREFAAGSTADPAGHALLATRLAPEKGIATAIEACRLAGIELVICGEGPERDRLGHPPGVRFAGHVDAAELARLRATAAVALVPSRSAETFGLAAAEAMAAGVPVAASRIGALPELVLDESLVPPGDAPALAAAVERLRGDRAVGQRGLDRVRQLCEPATVAGRLAAVYDD